MNPAVLVLRPLVITFLFLTGVFLLLKLFFGQWNIGTEVILIANCLFFLVSLLVFRIQAKAMADKNPQVFVRSIMVGMMIKMGVVVAAVAGYVLPNVKGFSRPAVYISLLLYIVYLAVEVAAVTKLNKRKNA